MNFDPVGKDSKGEYFMKFNQPFSPLEKIQLLQRSILVNSFAYYELNENILTDFQYDNNAKQLVDLINKYPEEAKRSRYYSYFYDYTGETGYHLLGRVEKDNAELYRHINIDATLALDLKQKRGVTV